jgi:hypothetical protein
MEKILTYSAAVRQGMIARMGAESVQKQVTPNFGPPAQGERRKKGMKSIQNGQDLLGQW